MMLTVSRKLKIADLLRDDFPPVSDTNGIFTDLLARLATVLPACDAPRPAPTPQQSELAQQSSLNRDEAA